MLLCFPQEDTLTVNEQQVPLNEGLASDEAAPETQLGEKEGESFSSSSPFLT